MRHAELYTAHRGKGYVHLLHWMFCFAIILYIIISISVQMVVYSDLLFLQFAGNFIAQYRSLFFGSMEARLATKVLSSFLIFRHARVFSRPHFREESVACFFFVFFFMYAHLG